MRLGVRLAALRDAGGAFELGDEQGNTHGAVDGVVLTAPAPQAADLLDRSPGGGARAALVRTLAYAPAVMVLAGVPGAGEGPAVERPAEGPLAEVRREAVKGRAGDPAPVVARLGPEASAALLDASDARVLEEALPALAALLGAEPAWSQVKRWRYAVPEGRLDADEVNPPGVRIVVAGDTVTGATFGGDDHHRVFASGVDGRPPPDPRAGGARPMRLVERAIRGAAAGATAATVWSAVEFAAARALRHDYTDTRMLGRVASDALVAAGRAC